MALTLSGSHTETFLYVHLLVRMGHDVLPMLSNEYCSHQQEFLHGHDEDISALAVSPSGQFIATGQVGSHGVKGYEAKVIIWDYSSRTVVYRLHGHTAAITSLAFSCDDRFLASTDADHKLYVWDMDSGDVLAGLTHDRLCNRVTWLADATDDGRGRKAAYHFVACFETSARLYRMDYNLRSLQYSITNDPFSIPASGLVRNFTGAVVDRADKYAYLGSTSGDVSIFNVQSKVFRHRVQVSTSGISSLYLSGSTLYVGCGDGLLKTYTVEGHSLEPDAAIQLSGRVSSIDISPDGAEIIAGSSDGLIYRALTTDLRSFTVSSTSVTGSLTGASFGGASNEMFTTASGDGKVFTWNLSTYDPVSVSGGVAKGVKPTKVAWSHDGSKLVAGWDDGFVRAYDAQSGRQEWVIVTAHRGAVTALAWTAGYIASGGEDGCLRVWSPTSRELIAQFGEHRKGIVSIVPDVVQPKLIHTASQDRAILTFDLEAERRVNYHTISDGALTAMVQRTTGEQELITASLDGVIRMWDCDEPGPVAEWVDKDTGMKAPGVPYRLRALALHPDQRWLATAGEQELVKVVDMSNNGKVVASGIGHSRPVTDLTWSPDGKQLVSVGEDRCVCVWNFFAEDAVQTA